MTEEKGSNAQNIEHFVSEILNPSDYEDASDALIELKKVDPKRAGELARAVLLNEEEEIHYRGFALGIFYDLSKEEALNYICSHAAAADIRLFDTMLETVTVDSNVMAHDPLYQKAVRCVANSMAARPKQELDEISDSVDWFKESFPNEVAK